MNRAGRWGANLLFAAVAGVAFLLLLIVSSPPGPEESRVTYGVTMAVLATPWALAAGILWRVWWLRTGGRLSAVDTPARLLAVAITALPEERREWGRAMTAELAQVPDRRARWRFAAGCAYTALFAPSGRRVPVPTVAAGAVAAVVGTWLVVGQVLPALKVFAVTFVLLVGVLATVWAARFRRRPAPPLAIAGLAGVAGSVGATAYSMATDASATLSSSAAVTLAVVLAGCLWLTLAPPRALTTSGLAANAGLGVALALGAGLFLAARLNDGAGVLGYVPIPGVVVFLAGALVALARQSVPAGIQTAMWAVVVTTLITFPVYLVEALRWYHVHQTALLDGDAGSIGSLHDAVAWAIVAVPLWSLPFGVIGAAVGRWAPRLWRPLSTVGASRS